MTRSVSWAAGRGLRFGKVIVALIVVALMFVGSFGYATRAHAAPSPTLKVYGYISPTSQITIWGDGFPAQEKATVAIGGVNAGTVFVHSLDPIDGSIDHMFMGQITIPDTVTPGAQVLAVTGQTSGVVVQTTIMVRQNWVEYGFDATGNRYNPYESVISASNVATLVPSWSANTESFAEEALVNGVVYVTDSSLIQAYSEATGSLIWGPFDTAPDTAPAVGEGYMFFGSSDHFWATSTLTGRTGWIYTGNGSQGEWFGAPTLTNGVVYVGSTYANIYAFAAGGCGASTCQPTWVTSLSGTIGYSLDVTVRPPAVVNGKVYAATAYGSSSPQGGLVVLDATSGAILWTAPLAGAAGTQVVVVGGYVYVPTSNGMVQVFSAAGCGHSMCSPLWSAMTNGHVFAAPVVAGGILYVGSEDGNLYAFNAGGCGDATCLPIWIAATDSGIYESPAVANGVVFISSFDGYLYAFNGAGCGQATCPWLWRYSTGSTQSSSPIVANGVVYVGSAAGGGSLLTFHPSGTTTGGTGSSRSPGGSILSHHPTRGATLHSMVPHGVIPL